MSKSCNLVCVAVIMHISGVNSDESIKECKGPSVMNDFERTHSVAGCRYNTQTSSLSMS